MSMQPFHLADEWTSPEDERALVAAVAKNPALYWELLDLLPAGAFADAEAAEAWEQLAAAVEAEKTPEAPPWAPAADPRATARSGGRQAAAAHSGRGLGTAGRRPLFRKPRGGAGGGAGGRGRPGAGRDTGNAGRRLDVGSGPVGRSAGRRRAAAPATRANRQADHWHIDGTDPP